MSDQENTIHEDEIKNMGMGSPETDTHPEEAK